MYRTALFFALIAAMSFACKSPNGQAQLHTQHKFTNHLIDESSPYLLQHAHNPVNWYPWGKAALAKAKAENKMLIISIGYSACHWCHVMEHESFEDTTVANIMNENFVCIKVDREERPDIDDVYMTACHLASGKSCGWPLNAFALPDGRAFWAGTYFPKKDWVNVLQHFIKMRKEENAKLENYATQITNSIQQNESIGLSSGDQLFTKDVLTKITDKFLENIDYKKGGRISRMKFPMPNNYQFLLQQYHYSKNPKALEAVNVTLRHMANGGIYDHLGGGFSRYSTDPDWHAPHFEKMLYDNGQLVSLYAQAYQLTKNPLYKKVVEETLAFVKRELTDPSGGFYSSLDADSEGKEGKFYVWKKAEVDSLLKDELLAKVFCDYYDIKANGNWEEHQNILQRVMTIDKVAKKNNIDTTKVKELVNQGKAILFKERSKRIRPGLDNKILTSWNGLMLKGYIDAYKAFGKKEYLDMAFNNASFILKNMLKDGHRLNRNYKDGKSVINAFLDDYASVIDAFTALYEVSFEEQWLYKAKALMDYVLTNFHDDKSGMFFYVSNLDPPLIARKKEISDNVIPASNSMIAKDLHKLGLYFYNNK
ncbi:MAG TPA: thioredoxin domain-containing protein, partial [Saprospiraceae bacterium]|nr:thioredoxin domain-containing protein [Saprospiraceae bacterium]